MNLQDENELDWQVMASNWSRLVYLHHFLLTQIAAGFFVASHFPLRCYKDDDNGIAT